MLNKLSLIIILLALYSYTNAQETFQVSGKVTNPKNKPISFANVVLYSSIDSSMVQGVMTEGLGEFFLHDIHPGKFYLKVLFIGFKPAQYSGIVVFDSNVEIPPIVLRRASTKLEEVTVVSEKGMFENQAGKLVYNVEGNINATGESADELLQNIPSVSLNMDDKVTVRGSKATVLIDGVESNLSEMLDQIPADAIESIEVMSNPSVKYDAKSGGSVVNIKLRKQSRTGYNGKFASGLGTLEKRNVDANLGYNLQNWRVSGLVNYQHGMKETLQKSTRTTLTSDYNNILIQEQKDKTRPTSLFTSGTVSYYLKDKSFVSFKYMLQKRTQDKNTFTNNESYRNGNLISISDIDREGENGNTFNQLSIRFRNKFKTEDNQLDGGILYSFNSPENQYEQLVQPFYIEDGEPQNNYKTDNKVYDNRVKLFKTNLDFTGRLSKRVGIEAGALFSVDHFTQNLLNIKTNYIWNDSEKEYESSENVKNKNFINRKYLGSLYVLLATSFRKYSLSSGVRMEYVRNETETDSIVSSSQLKLVPSLHLKKTVSEKYSWEVSMTARSKPPKYTQLNPISLSWGSYSKSSGNPNLKSEFFYQIEWSNQWKWEKSSVHAAVYFKNQSDIIGRWYFLEEEDGKQISHSRYENLGAIRSGGIDLSGMRSFGKLRIRPGAVCYFSKIDGDMFASTLDRQEFSYLFKMGAYYPISNMVSVQLSGAYNSPFISVYGKQFSYFKVDAGLKAKVFKKRGAVVLKVVDFLDTVEYDKLVNQRINYLKESHYDPKQFQIYMSLSYKFNSFKKKKKA